ncbi:MAG TPA: hypothetical protein VLJ84_01015 [Usitatibacter sp.]|nr:hypothetical protein [Usitatibacter sp.]
MIRTAIRAGAMLAAGLATATLALAQMSEDQAKQAAQEVKLLVTEGSAVVGDLQPQINSGKVDKAQVAPDAMVNAFKARYQKAAGAAFDTNAKGVIGDARRAFLTAYTSVVTRYQTNLTKGGQDAFVPAFFRAQVLKEFNQLMAGKVQAYATNRDEELINSDWAVHKVMKNSALSGVVPGLMKTGSLEPVVKKEGTAMMGYYPMKLAPACVACHAQNGLKQTEGGFGGALVVEIPVK